MAEVAREAMALQSRKLGNPSSLHSDGRAVRKDIEDARESLAHAIGCQPNEIIFTGSGTEANNSAIKGFLWKGKPKGKELLAISAIEHHAILDPAHWLQEYEGVEIHALPVGRQGVLELAPLRELISQRGDEIALISIMHSNNETGALQPIAEVVALAKAAGIAVHSDAVQSFGKVPLSFSQLGLDAMTLSAHKVGGPLGIGALVLKHGLEIPALLHGGGQERDIRSGTLNAPAIVGFAAAAKKSMEAMATSSAALRALREEFIGGVLGAIPDAFLNGVQVGEALPGIVNITFPGTESDTLLLLLDGQGISCSTGSACSAGVQRPSHVLLAMGHADKSARSTLRFSMGSTTTRDEIERVIAILPGIIDSARKANLR